MPFVLLQAMAGNLPKSSLLFAPGISSFIRNNIFGFKQELAWYEIKRISLIMYDYFINFKTKI